MGRGRPYDERQLAALVLSIATTNLFKRLNIAAGQVWRVPGAERPEAVVLAGSLYQKLISKLAEGPWRG
jgi:hypothetical protein